MSFLDVWVKKLKGKVSAEKLEQDLRDTVDEIKKKHGNRWPEKKIWIKARTHVFSQYKSQMKSTAGDWVVYIRGKDTPNDYGNRRYEAALEAANKNLKKAVRSGLIRVKKDARGKIIERIPIDNRKKTSTGKINRRFNKALPKHEWIMNIYGLALPFDAYEDILKNEDSVEWDKIKPLIQTLSQDYADPTDSKYLGGVEEGKWYSIKATNKTPKNETAFYQLNATKLTKWDDELTGLDFNDPEVFLSYFVGLETTIDGLEEYHDKYAKKNKENTKSYSNRLVCVRGEVIDLVLAEPEDYSHRIVIDDPQTVDGDDWEDDWNEEDFEMPDSITIWVDKEVPIEFGIYSEIGVIGSTSKSRVQEFGTNRYIDEWQTPNISAKIIEVIDFVEPDYDEEAAGEEEEDYEYEDEDGVDVEEPDIEAADDEEYEDDEDYEEDNDSEKEEDIDEDEW